MADKAGRMQCILVWPGMGWRYLWPSGKDGSVIITYMSTTRSDEEDGCSSDAVRPVESIAMQV